MTQFCLQCKRKEKKKRSQMQNDTWSQLEKNIFFFFSVLKSRKIDSKQIFHFFKLLLVFLRKKTNKINWSQSSLKKYTCNMSHGKKWLFFFFLTSTTSLLHTHTYDLHLILRRGASIIWCLDLDLSCIYETSITHIHDQTGDLLTFLYIHKAKCLKKKKQQHISDVLPG